MTHCRTFCLYTDRFFMTLDIFGHDSSISGFDSNYGDTGSRSSSRDSTNSLFLPLPLVVLKRKILQKQRKKMQD